MGFGKLLHFKVNGIPQKIGHYTTDNLDVSSMKILGQQGPFEVNQEVVFRLLGILNGGIDLKTVNPTRNLFTKFQEWRNLYPNEYISPSELVKRLGEAGDDVSFNFKVDFLMWFISTIVECHAHGKCKLDVLNYIGDETQIWALAILTLLYVDNVQCKGMNLDHTIPPIEFWNMEKLKQREVLELKEVSESGNLGSMMDLERMLEQTMCNKKKLELAIVKKFEDEPNNHMVRLIAIKFERIFSEKPCVVESLKEKEVRKNNEETCQMSHEVFDSALADDIDDTIMDLCLEINKRRQRWIESEDEEDPVDLGKVDKTIKADPVVNKSYVSNLSCPSFSLGFTQTQAEKNNDVEQSDKTKGDSLDIFPGFNVGVSEAEYKERRRISGDELSEKMNMDDYTQNMTVAGCKLVGRTKSGKWLMIYCV
ncbi:hypothetical protein E3N88_38996 [Mikania micrantha]|uniref:Uncharacterized protein n=1 Tax=Mikania micrantha TaxID=192012 RepID=A0A5N6LVI6_9ASTR|nr:hypothetical protein E3N88_38996 [Mikania micrantha]